jgi:hypothetical protein
MRVRISLLFWTLGCGIVVASCGSTKTSGFGSSSGSGSGSSGGSSGGSGSGSSSGVSGSSSGSGFNVDGGFGDGGQMVTGMDPTTCAEAAMGHTYIGCDYWPTVTTNIVWSTFDFAVVVANAGMDTANITVTGPGGVNQTAMAAPGGLATIYLPWVASLKGPDCNTCGGWDLPGTMKPMAPGPLANSVLAKGGAYHLVSSVPVTVYQFNALEYQGMGGPAGKDWSTCPGLQACPPPQGNGSPNGCFSFTNDASLLLPSTAMTGNVRVVNHPGLNATPLGPPQFPAGSSYPGMSPFAAITATADNTMVTVTVSSTGQVLASANGTDIAATSAGGVLKLTMNAGDVAELTGPQSDTSDLSGTLVQANNPIQVITGTSCLNLPEGAVACDHTEETNFPAETLGKDYIVAQPMGPEGYIVGHKVRILGNVDGTNLTYSPSTPPGCPTTINAGQVVDCGAALGNVCLDTSTISYDGACGPGNIVTQDFEVTGDHEFAVSTFSEGASLVDIVKTGTTSCTPPTLFNPTGTGCDPMTQFCALPTSMSTTGTCQLQAQQGDPDQSLATAVQQYRTKYVFLAPTDYEQNYATVIAPMGTTISIDGTVQSATLTPVGSNGYGVARILLATGNAGAHVLTASKPVGLQVMGYGSYTSYTYPGGSDLTLIAPPPPPPQ